MTILKTRKIENIIEKIKLAKDSENTVEGYISKDTNFRSNKSRESFVYDNNNNNNNNNSYLSSDIKHRRENKNKHKCNVIQGFSSYALIIHCHNHNVFILDLRAL